MISLPKSVLMFWVTFSLLAPPSRRLRPVKSPSISRSRRFHYLYIACMDMPMTSALELELFLEINPNWRIIVALFAAASSVSLRPSCGSTSSKG